MNLHSQDAPGQEADQPRPQSRIRKPQPARAALPADNDGIDFATLLRTAWAHKRTILSVAAVFIGLSLYYVISATPLYTAKASLILKPDQANMMGFESIMPGLNSDEETMNTELLILESHSLLGQVVENLSLTRDPEFNPGLRPEAAWKEFIGLEDIKAALGREPDPPPTPVEIQDTAIDILRDRLDVTIVPSTFAIDAAIETDDPEKSARIANTLADLYIQKQLEQKFTAMSDAMVWLGQRVAELKEELEGAESRVRRFVAQSTVFTEEGLLLHSEKLNRLRDDLASKREATSQLANRIARLEGLRAAGDFAALAEFTTDPQLRRAARALTGSEAEDPRLTRFEILFEQRLGELREDRVRMERQIESLVRGVTGLESELNVRSSDFVQLQQLQREAEATRLIYEHSLARLKEISIQQGIQRPDARVLDPAKLPDGPSHPRTLLTLFVGGFLGTAFGLLVVLVGQAMRTTFQSSEELEAATGLAVLGIIPAAPRTRQPGGVLKQIIDKPASPVAEAIRNLRTTIQLSNLDEPPQVIMLTSSVPGEGKSTVSAALAQANALSGKRVLLVDADLRRRAQKEYFDIDRKVGLLSVLSGAASFDEAVYYDNSSQMDILIADEGNVTAGDIFGSHRFESFLGEARRIYDIVVIDTPPILAISDTRALAQYADAIIYIVKWNSTPQKVLRAGLDTLRQVNADVTGIALNQVKVAGSDRYGYYGYSYT